MIELPKIAVIKGNAFEYLAFLPLLYKAISKNTVIFHLLFEASV